MALLFNFSLTLAVIVYLSIKKVFDNDNPDLAMVLYKFQYRGGLLILMIARQGLLCFSCGLSYSDIFSPLSYIFSFSARILFQRAVQSKTTNQLVK